MGVATVLTERKDLLEQAYPGWIMPGMGKCPEINIGLEKEDTTALADSGSQGCFVSTECWERVKVGNPNVPMIPATGLRANGAFRGTKQRKVASQVLIAARVGGAVVDMPFLVIPELHRDCIIGTNWFDTMRAAIDWDDHTVKVRQLGVTLPFLTNSDGEFTGGDSCHITLSWEDEEGAASGDVKTLSINALSLEEEDDDEVVVRSPYPSGLPEHALATIEQLREAVKGVPGLSTAQGEGLLALLSRNRPAFSDRPGQCQAYQPNLKLIRHAPFVAGYPIAMAKREPVRKKISQMLKWGVIERGESSYISPIHPVWKANGSVRLTLDGRRINELLEQDRECPRRTDELLFAYAGDIGVMSTADCSEGFWQLVIPQSQRKYVAFMFEGKVYRFCRLPFGLHLSTGAFQKAVDKVLGTPLTRGEIRDTVQWFQLQFPGVTVPEVRQDPDCFVDSFVDDIRIKSKDFWTHLVHLDLVLRRMIKGGMTFKLTKLNLCCEELPFLGHIISTRGVRVDPEYIQAIQGFATPRNVTHLRAFLGMCGWYRVFVRWLALYADPLNELFRKGVKWEWTEAMQQAFEKLKSSFLEVVMIKYPIKGAPYYIQCDASSRGLGAQIFQYDQEGNERVLGFASRTLKGAELRYTVTEKEALSILFALQKFRTWILGEKVIILSDHKALSFLMRCSHLSDRLYRWLLYIQEYQVEIRHVKGTEVVVSDTLSRYPLKDNGEGVGEGEEPQGLIIARLELGSALRFRPLLRELPVQQRDDPTLGEIIRRVETGPQGGDERLDRLAARHQEKGGVWFRRGEDEVWRVVVPTGMAPALITLAHEEMGHFGAMKVIYALQEYFTMRGLARAVKKVTGVCDLCQKAKVWTQCTEGEMHHVLVDGPGKLVCTDLFGPLVTSRGNVKYVLVFVDAFSKYVSLFTLQRAKALHVVNVTRDKYLPMMRRTIGCPEAILSDRGGQYRSAAWYQLARREGFRPTHCSVRHPQSNPAERVMREIGRILRTYCHAQHQSWALVVGKMESWLNAVHHDSTGLTPYELHMGIPPVRPWQRYLPDPPDATPRPAREQLVAAARERIVLRAAERKRRHDEGKSKLVTYEVGDKVLLKADRESDAIHKEMKKLFLLYDGPFTICRVAAPNAYELEKEGNIRGVFNAANLRPYKTLEPVRNIAVVQGQIA